MGTRVLMVDDNAARYDQRRKEMAAAGVEVISAFEEQQAAEALKSDRVDVICIDSQFVMTRGEGVVAFLERRMLTIPVLLITDDARVPQHIQRYVDIVVDREDFPTTGKRLMQQLTRGQVPFFQQWFCEWAIRTSQSMQGEVVRVG